MECMCVCVCVCMCVCVSVHMCVSVCTCVCLCAYLCACLCVCVCARVCLCVCQCVRSGECDECECVCVCVYKLAKCVPSVLSSLTSLWHHYSLVVMKTLLHHSHWTRPLGREVGLGLDHTDLP